MGREPLVALMRDAWVAETRADAEAVYGPEVMTAYKYYWRNGLPEFSSIQSEDELTLGNLGRGSVDSWGAAGMRIGVSTLERGGGCGLLPAPPASRPLRRPAP